MKLVVILIKIPHSNIKVFVGGCSAVIVFFKKTNSYTFYDPLDLIRIYGHDPDMDNKNDPDMDNKN